MIPQLTNRPGDALVVFGLTGDLGHAELIPGIALLHATGRLDVPVVGVGRTRPDDVGELVRSTLDDTFAARLGTTVDALVDEMDLRFVGGDATESDTWEAVAADLGDVHHPVVYAALPPALLGDVARTLAASSLSDTAHLVLEKPFGDDAASARALYDEITDAVDARYLFLVDHFLAKGTIHNLVSMRRTPILDRSLRREAIESVAVDFPEARGLEGRGSFYESVGVIADVVQNHLLQTVASALCEPVLDRDDPEAIRASRLELLRSIAPIDPGETVLGQYDGYRDVDDVDPDSQVPTFVDTVLHADADRWKDVPIRLRTGKCLTPGPFEVTWRFEESVPTVAREARARLQPDAAFEIDLAGLDPSTHGTVTTTACAPIDAEHGERDAYAVVLGDALAGSRRHMSSIDEIVACWKIVEPILGTPRDLQTYRRGSRGPS